MLDPVVEEVRRIREKHAARFDYDVDAIFADLKRAAKVSGQPRVSFGPKRIARVPPDAHRRPAARKRA